MCQHLWKAFPGLQFSKTESLSCYSFYFHSLSAAVYLTELLYVVFESTASTSYKFREGVKYVLFILLSSKIQHDVWHRVGPQKDGFENLETLLGG